MAALVAIDVLLVARERQDEILRESVANRGCLVAREAAAIAGFLTLDRGFFGRPFVRLLVVAPAYRRRGAGRALVAAAERTFAGDGELFISTEHVNAPMQALLGAMAYLPSGSIENINPPGNPELVFHKRLPA